MNNMFNMLNMLMSMGNNPQQIINNFVKQNPQAQVILNQMQQSGMSPQQYLNQYANQNGLGNVVNQMYNMLNIRNGGRKF